MFFVQGDAAVKFFGLLCADGGGVGFDVYPEGIEKIELFGLGEIADIRRWSDHRVESRNLDAGCQHTADNVTSR